MSGKKLVFGTSDAADFSQYALINSDDRNLGKIFPFLETKY